MTIKAPTPENYKKWYQDRIDRTIEVMKKQAKIPGHQVAKENLSASYLYKNGYVLDNNDTLVRSNNG